MWLNWLPWKYVVRRIARANGFVDPISMLSRLYAFAQPSEVAAPIELLRAGVVFHARGLMNTKAIQQNLDWVWPYWVRRQFDPQDDAFLPRAFSVTHVNLTLRNWTAVGTPGCNALPVVDPRGLVTPFFDGWSLDGWLVCDDGQLLLPPRLDEVCQLWLLEPDGLAIRTEGHKDGLSLTSEARVLRGDGNAVCQVVYRARADRDGWLAVALRPANPEGVSFIHTVALGSDRRSWDVNGRGTVVLSEAAERHVVSQYAQGDVCRGLRVREDRSSVQCNVGLATAAALYRLRAGESREIRADIPLAADVESKPLFPKGADVERWSTAISGAARLDVPDDRLRFLYDAAVRTLVLCSPHEAYPGPYTYKRFWFRDAAYIVHALLCAGLTGRAEAVLNTFPSRQALTGFFKSQEGEWDSNGEALWIFRRFVELTGAPLKETWYRATLRGAEWILFKRLSEHLEGLHAGLMPAGFSAEHLGNNDYYYWDDFWSVAGLEAAAVACENAGDAKAAERFRRGAQSFRDAIDRSIEGSRPLRNHPGIPASPYRRMDAGAVGSIVADYPLRLFPPAEPRLRATIDYLMERCFVKGAFFQDMIHSGINAYLTLQLAQVLLRAGDPRFFDLVQTVAGLASPTGQWPEAIHPHTGGGCMGDGQHVWAAAEWVLMLRNMFVREEGNRLILASGIPAEWLERQEPLRFGPAPTPCGDVTVTVRPEAGRTVVSWEARWRGQPPSIEVRLPGHTARIVDAGQASEAVVRNGILVEG